jgi:hypothetical protein
VKALAPEVLREVIQLRKFEIRNQGH